MILPSRMTTPQLREHCEAAVAHGTPITVNAPDLLALLVALDLRERLDSDVAHVARAAIDAYQYGSSASSRVVCTAAHRVLAHEPAPQVAS